MPRALPVELVGAVRRLADQHEARVADPLDQRVVGGRRSRRPRGRRAVRRLRRAPRGGRRRPARPLEQRLDLVVGGLREVLVPDARPPGTARRVRAHDLVGLERAAPRRSTPGRRPAPRPRSGRLALAHRLDRRPHASSRSRGRRRRGSRCARRDRAAGGRRGSAPRAAGSSRRSRASIASSLGRDPRGASTSRWVMITTHAAVAIAPSATSGRPAAELAHQEDVERRLQRLGRSRRRRARRRAAGRGR